MLRLVVRTELRDQRTQASCIGGSALVPLFLMLNVMLGCAAVLTPMTPGANDSLSPDEGLVLGRIHISNGEAFASSRQPFRTSFHMQWRLKDQKLGKEFVIDPLPKDGPFAVKLPTGSYELTALSFDTALGIWQAALPATFTVTSQACTYLGTWELRANAGFFGGSIVRHVIDQHALAENDLQTFVNDRPGRPIITELSTPMTSPLMLTFRTQGTELTSPP